ncbi:MAG: hypothetical protein EXR62_16525 [Chloroflexi bacterium]|nr:hypothetical protein [Chloroflexota bacterium]
MSSVVIAIALVVGWRQGTSFAAAPPPVASPSLYPGGCGLIGDVNSDAIVDRFDLLNLVSLWHQTGISDLDLYDLVHNQRIDVADVMTLVQLMGKACQHQPIGVQMFDEVFDTSALQFIKEGNMRWIRLYNFSWERLEPTQTGGTYWPNFDAVIQRTQKDGLHVLATLQGYPSWAASTPCGPIDKVPLSRYAELITKLVKRYGGNGGSESMPGLRIPIKYWEIGNEPDWDRIAHAPGLCFGGDVNANGTTDAYEYADMLKVVYQAIKAADPTAQVVYGSIAYDYAEDLHFSMDFTDKVLERLSADPQVVANNCYFDVMGFHQFDAYRSNWDSLNRPWNQALVGKASAVRSILARYSACANKPLISTEIGLQIGASDLPDDPIAAEIQARHMARMFIEVQASNMLFAFWYTFGDKDSLKYGLFPSNSLQARPAYYVLRNLSLLMEGYQFERQIDVGNANVQAFRFSQVSNPDRKRLALWFDNGNRIKNLNPPNTFYENVIIGSNLFPDWNGRIRVTQRLANGPDFDTAYSSTTVDSFGNLFVQISVTSDPILIETSTQ